MFWVDIHTHNSLLLPETISIRNIFPGEGFAAFNTYNYYSVGLHPWHIQLPAQNDILLEQVEKTLGFEHVVFMGECGLDKLTNTDFNEQLRVFEKQVELSEKYGKPLMIHCVKAYNEILQLKNRQFKSMPWILHGFNGNSILAAQLLEAGFYFSFGKILFNEKAKVKEAFYNLPMSNVFFETDELDIHIKEIYKKAAEIKGIAPFELKREVFDNFNRVIDKKNELA